MDQPRHDHVLPLVQRLKESAHALESPLPVLQDGRLVPKLVPVSWLDVSSGESIALLARWREAAADSFPSQFPVTLAGTQRWLVKQLLEVSDRLLFWVESPEGQRIGHLGLFHFDLTAGHVELDNVVRGTQGVLPGAMTGSVHCLLDWTFTVLNMETVFLRVFSDNDRALRLYEQCGFRETMRMPLARIVDGESIRWIEVDGGYRQPVQRYFVTMHLPRRCWQASNPFRLTA